MFLTVVVIVVVSAALVAGAAWGVYGKLPSRVEGFIVALAGGALIVSAVLELIEPATDVAPLWAVAGCVLIGAAAFAGLDRIVKTKLGSDSGGGLLVAITLDGIPENLALGVALIGAGPLAIEVFPKAFKEDTYMTGIAAALGLVLAIGLDQLG